MKRDKIEQYIIEHRKDLDGQAPPADSWDNIQPQLRTKTASFIRYWQAAAVIFFVLSLGLLIKNYQKVDNQNVPVVLSEFSETEEYYFQVVKDKELILDAYLDKYPELASDFKADLEELGKNYRKLKTDFDTTGSIEVLNALIYNLRLQQELLNNQLEIIQLIENENEDISI